MSERCDCKSDMFLFAMVFSLWVMAIVDSIQLDRIEARISAQPPAAEASK